MLQSHTDMLLLLACHIIALQGHLQLLHQPFSNITCQSALHQRRSESDMLDTAGEMAISQASRNWACDGSAWSLQP